VGFTYSSPAAFYDFVIDGTSLRQLLETNDIGVLSDRRSGAEVARELLLERPSDEQLGGRVQIYGCRECLDIWCGGIAAVVTRQRHSVRWECIERFQVDYSDNGEGFVADFVFVPIGSASYEFDLEQYRTTLARFLR